MTLYPECVLAKEMELCYVTICMVTDYDVWAEKPVSTEEIKRTLGENSQHFKDLIMQAIPKMPRERTCQCGSALKDALV
jgi:5'-methylthioadenosine phosphorylase